MGLQKALKIKLLPTFRTMVDFEFSFTFDEGNYTNDFSGDLYDFENMWQELAEEFRQKEEIEELQELFHEKLHIAPKSEVDGKPY